MTPSPYAGQFAITVGPLEMPVRDALDRAVNHDIRHIQWSANHAGMRPRELDQSARRDLLATVRRRGLRLAGLDLWIPLGHFDSKEQGKRAIESLLAAIVLAEDLGRICLSTNLPVAEQHQRIVELIDAESQRRGVTIADHHVEALERRDSLIGVGIDPAAVLASAGDPATAVIDAADRCKSARLSDLLTSGDRGPIGRAHGQLDVIAYCGALAAIEYDQPMVIDCRGWHEPWSGIRRTIDAWKDAVPTF